ncbi:MAG: hypothetical protein WC269_01010 [Candidatus Gracilibacteria bacterium]|jgi:hypothetical protein
MAKTSPKIRIIAASALFAFMAAFVQVPEVYAADGGDLNVVACTKAAIEGRFKNYSQFLLDQISFDGLLGDIVDPWQDAIFTNECQAYDLFALTDRRDQIESSIRNSFLACKYKDLEVQKKMYYRITAEIWYVRNVINRFKLFWMPNILKSALYGRYLANSKLDPAKNDALIKEQFMKKFKKRFTDEKELNQLFFDISAKYQDRVPTYIICPDNPLTKVWQKLIEFGQFWGLVDGGESLFDKAEKTWDSTVAQSAKQVVDYGKMFASPEAWLAHVSINVNGVDVMGIVSGALLNNPKLLDATKEDLEKEFGDEASKIMPLLDAYKDAYKKTKGSQSGFNDLYQNLKETSDMDIFRRTMSEKFQAEYLFSDANTYVFVNELDKLDQTINDTYASLDAVKMCSEKVSED